MVKIGDWYKGYKSEYLFVINKIGKKYLYVKIFPGDNLYLNVDALKGVKSNFRKVHPSGLSPECRKLIEHIFYSWQDDSRWLMIK
jgi:hypothetical protein